MPPLGQLEARRNGYVVEVNTGMAVGQRSIDGQARLADCGDRTGWGPDEGETALAKIPFQPVPP